MPKGSHWVDLTEPGTIVVIEQPEGQKCAAVGGIMAQRMKVRGAAGCVVGGRVRDFAELKNSGLTVGGTISLDLDLHDLSCAFCQVFADCIDLLSRSIYSWNQCRVSCLRT